MNILAIDPGYDRLGVAIFKKQSNTHELIYSACFETEKKLDFVDRVCQVGQHVRLLISQYAIDTLVIEGLFFSKNTKTALQVSETRGAIIFQARDVGIPVFEYTPNQIKVAVTGYGRATKNDVHTMVHKLISLDTQKRRDDEIDAIAIGLTFLASHREIHS